MLVPSSTTMQYGRTVDPLLRHKKASDDAQKADRLWTTEGPWYYTVGLHCGKQRDFVVFRVITARRIGR